MVYLKKKNGKRKAEADELLKEQEEAKEEALGFISRNQETT